MSNAIITALGLVFVIEVLLYALVPLHLKGMMKKMQDTQVELLRICGVVAVSIGVFLVWLARSF